MFALENMCALQGILGLKWGSSLPNSGDFDDNIFKMSKFPWVARTPPPPGGKH